MPYSTSMPSDILSQNKIFDDENKDIQFKQKNKRQTSKEIILNQIMPTINDYSKNSTFNIENESDKENIVLNTNLKFLNSRDLEKTNMLLNFKAQENMHCLNNCSKNLCSLCASNNIKQRRETVLGLINPSTNESNLNLISKPNLQIELRKYLNNQHFLSNQVMTSSVGYDVFLSCSSSNELEWITQKAVPQLQCVIFIF